MWISLLQNISLQISIYIINFFGNKIRNVMGRKNKIEKKHQEKKKPKLDDTQHIEKKHQEKKKPKLDDTQHMKTMDIKRSEKDEKKKKSENHNVKENWDDEDVNDTDIGEKQRNAVTETPKDVHENREAIKDSSKSSKNEKEKAKKANNQHDSNHETDCEENNSVELPITQSSDSITESKPSVNGNKVHSNKSKNKKKPKNDRDGDYEMECQENKTNDDIPTTSSNDETKLIEDSMECQSVLEEPVSSTQSTEPTEDSNEIHSTKSKKRKKSKKKKNHDREKEFNEEPASSTQSNSAEEWNEVCARKQKKNKDSKKDRDKSSHRKDRSSERDRHRSSHREKESRKKDRSHSSHRKDYWSDDDETSHQKRDENTTPRPKNEPQKQNDNSKKDDFHDRNSKNDSNHDPHQKNNRNSHDNQKQYEPSKNHNGRYNDQGYNAGPSNRRNESYRNENLYHGRGAKFDSSQRGRGKPQFGQTNHGTGAENDSYYDQRNYDRNKKFPQNRENYGYSRGNNSYGPHNMNNPYYPQMNNQYKKKSNKQPLFVVNAEHYEPTIREIEGDLFEVSKEYSLGHCVAEDLSMGAGIAIEFKKRFKAVDDLWNQNKRTGEVAFLRRSGRYIFYIITKAKSYGKPTLESLAKAVHSLKELCIELNVKKLAIPRIGSGLDRLDWNEVKDILYNEFKDTDIEILVHVL